MAKTRKRVVFLITFIILIFFMVPFFVLVINSFKTTNEFITAPFSLPKEFNIENFKTAIQRMNFWSALRNTAAITVASVAVNMLIGSMTGYFFARKKWKINKVIFAAFLASMVAPFQVYMIPLVKIYAGQLGFSNNLMMVAYIAVGLNLPFAVFLYKGFAEGIPEELDEAAKIDGASPLQRIRLITFPMVRPAFTVSLFLTLSNSFKLFDQNLALTNGGPGNATQMLALNIYQTAFSYNKMSLAQAKAVIFFILVAVIALTQVYLTKKGEVEA